MNIMFSSGWSQINTYIAVSSQYDNYLDILSLYVASSLKTQYRVIFTLHAIHLITNEF